MKTGVTKRAVENALKDLLNSDAESRIYVFLSLKGGAKSSEIARGTRLHPSTVRELLAKMYRKRLVYRKKMKSKLSGKNPYFYYAASPLKILQMYTKKMEERFNSIASLTRDQDNIKVEVRIVRET
ncbi:MAG TPA: TrmB family transcriptional regulator [Thermoplasmatales archaeon]|nr:TrmB family transcriptional regulator [Thermoplasmatales archaeon]